MKKKIKKPAKGQEYLDTLSDILRRAVDSRTGESGYHFVDSHIDEFDYSEVYAFLLFVTLYGMGGPIHTGLASFEGQIAMSIYILLQKDRKRFFADLKKDFKDGFISQEQLNEMEYEYKKVAGYIEFEYDPPHKLWTAADYAKVGFDTPSIPPKITYRDKKRFDAFFNTMERLGANEAKYTQFFYNCEKHSVKDIIDFLCSHGIGVTFKKGQFVADAIPKLSVNLPNIELFVTSHFKFGWYCSVVWGNGSRYYRGKDFKKIRNKAVYRKDERIFNMLKKRFAMKEGERPKAIKDLDWILAIRKKGEVHFPAKK